MITKLVVIELTKFLRPKKENKFDLGSSLKSPVFFCFDFDVLDRNYACFQTTFILSTYSLLLS